MSTAKYSCICKECGSLSTHTFETEKSKFGLKGDILLGTDAPRMCPHCHKESCYVMVVDNTYRNIYGLVQRIRKLEERLKDGGTS